MSLSDTGRVDDSRTQNALEKIRAIFPLQAQHIADDAITPDHLSSVVARTAFPPAGRLTLTTATPVTSSDVTAASTIYYTPYAGNTIALYDGTSWQPFTFTERSLALSGLTSGLNYDVFLYDNAGTLTLELTAWTNDTTRATALTTQDGVYVKTGATTRRYLGTIRTTATTTTEDSAAKRFVWNAYNRRRRHLKRAETATSWTYNTNAWRQANANAANQVEAVHGLAEDAVEFMAALMASAPTNSSYQLSIGVDATTPHADAGITYSGQGVLANHAAQLKTIPAAGYHAYKWIERTTNTAGGATTVFGENTDSSQPYTRAHIEGTVLA